MTCKSDDNVVANRHLPQIENGYPNKGWHCAVKWHCVTVPNTGQQVATELQKTMYVITHGQTVRLTLTSQTLCLVSHVSTVTILQLLYLLPSEAKDTSHPT
jgi:hypothetical protein